jgi:hypothetical protein
MKPAEQEIEEQRDNWNFSTTVTVKDNLMDKKTLKGSQFAPALLEYNGACPGCGETPYVKLITQLFGDRMMIANATGCSSIWSASSPSIAYTKNAEGKGPAWANSLFEDNAEFGYGMYLGVQQIRRKLADLMEQSIAQGVPEAVGQAFRQWLASKDDGEASKPASANVVTALTDTNRTGNKLLEEIFEKKDFLVKKSFWILGGDGWASVSKYASAADLEGSVYCSAYASGTTDEIAQFEKDYTAAYGADTLNMFAALGYDAAVVLLDALKVAEGKNLKAGSAEYKATVIDAYSMPLKADGILDIAQRNGGKIVSVEDNYTGGLDSELSDAIAAQGAALALKALYVHHIPKSGREPQDVLDYLDLGMKSILAAV